MSTGSSMADLSSSATNDEEFIAKYYEHLAADDAASYSPDVLSSRALAHRELAAHRPPAEPVIGIHDEPDASVVMIVTDDMPFLVDSVTAEVVRHGIAIRMIMHPTFVATRDRDSHDLTGVERVPTSAGVSSGDTAALPNLAAFEAGSGKVLRIESWMAVETARIDPAKAAELEAGLKRVLADVRASVEDWPAMRRQVRQVAASLDSVVGAEEIPDLAEAKALLEWLDDGNFTFLGYREYDLVTQNGEDVLLVRQDSGLGMMRRVADARRVQHLTEEGRARAREKRALVITKANSRSTVHRAAYLDYIGVKSFDAQGNVDGERRFIGLFATSAYNRLVKNVPIVRQKVAAVLRHSGFPADSHSGKDLLSILETYPRDELFQMDTDELAATAMGILRLQERRRTRLFLRADVYGRFVSALVFLPRDRYTTAVRLRIEGELRRTFDPQSIDYEARMSESALARLFFRIRLKRDSGVPKVDTAELERRLAQASRSWSEGIDEVLRANFDGEAAARLSANWKDAFPPSYRVDYEVEDALEDISRFRSYEGGEAEAAPVLHVYVPEKRTDVLAADARLKLYLPEARSLSNIMPILQNTGLEVLDERPFEIMTADGEDYFLYDFGLRYPAGVDPIATGGLLEEAFGAAVTGRSESDGFDRLVLAEGIGWRQVAVLRAYTRYLRQLGNLVSYAFVSDTLLANPDVARALLAVFNASFDPDLDGDREAAVEAARSDLAAGLDAVPTLDADRVLRSLSNLIGATLRTNYFQNKTYFSFKLSPARIEGAPFPRPKYEIWVYSPRVEGVHLRFGDVARGGLRWSDRREDFRTEILGLVKAQTVKNAVIVPTGAKGGFYAKRLPDPGADRAAWMAEGQDSYRTFIRGLLDITDNLVRTESGQKVVPPERVVRMDGDDTYLVVAADKGTASFSDIANDISLEYGHWLGDAFASGGSVGYDHKEMGITARGAWESVKRHFSELGVDTQAEDFTVVGVGDMSGDVFGNGMLLSEHIKLVAAFDHRHIFLDPDPDAAASFQERRRLFELPRSSWADYDDKLISAGGGVYPRSVKSVPVSEQVRGILGLDPQVTSMSPPELLQAILRAPVDLLYNGGIGTYVKASTESNAEVGDKANDPIRVNGNELRVKVIGEGGNLGMTQRGRIEAASQGIILNTDAIDNSAGVDCSDHEVNIKILVDQMVAAGKLPVEERSGLLHSMTEEVGRLVIQDNIDQNVLLLNDRQHITKASPSFERLMDWLENHAELDRELEALPTTEELHERIDAGLGLTSPELSVLAAYSKIELTHALTVSNLADDPYFDRVLRGYFPQELVERFGDELSGHPLRREIIATVVANDMINMGGITFAFRVLEETSVSEADVARAFVALREIFEFDKLVAELNELPASFPTDLWCTVHLDMRRLLDRAVRWYINHVDSGTPVADGIAAFKPQMDPLRSQLVKYLRGDDLARVRGWLSNAEERGLPEEIARQWAEQFESFGLLDVARIAGQVDEPVASVAHVYFTVYDRFDIDDLLERITALPREDRWQSLARAALRDDLYTTVTDITVAVMQSTQPGEQAEARIDEWEQANAENIKRVRDMFEEVNKLEKDDMASLSVALRLMRSTVRR
ncbi:NAD-glutamate dehydrogenase [Arthrobacter sulfonylureivorans]|uniref:NAD-glutamate dehydrogenase n=1 Tax=Arthrobacter sulfonylureivorans TaxID=2486855 RepID=A0ABY3W9P0_9MICC|nr:NAD-glutamate dehydrogenase [Arthrobacter sulfonylureivorans]UNK47069.1 NAD-glutamate dehydrogenase [Arthrobacter sulfonylureivorans]